MKKAIITLIAISFFVIGCNTPYTNDFLGQGVSVDDIIDDLDAYAEPGECVTDGFDWVCRGPRSIVISEVEVIREVEVPVEVTPPMLRLVLEIPEVVDGETDFTYEGMDGTVNVEDDQVVVSLGDTQVVTEATEGEVSIDVPVVPPVIRSPVDRGWVVTYEERNGHRFSGVIHSKYIEVESNRVNGFLKVWYLGSDGERDAWDTHQLHIAVERGYTYEQASERVRTIFNDYN